MVNCLAALQVKQYRTYIIIKALCLLLAQPRPFRFAQVQQRAEVSKDRAEQASLLDEKISELEGQYGKLMIDGDAEKAAEVMKEIRTLNRQVARLESQEESTAVVSQQIEAQRLETTIARLEADNPVLNPKSDAYDDDIVQMIILVQRNLVQNGLPPSHAMAQATDRVLGKLNAAGQARAEKEGLGKAEADAAAARDDRSKKGIHSSWSRSPLNKSSKALSLKPPQPKPVAPSKGRSAAKAPSPFQGEAA